MCSYERRASLVGYVRAHLTRWNLSQIGYNFPCERFISHDQDRYFARFFVTIVGVSLVKKHKKRSKIRYHLGPLIFTGYPKKVYLLI